MKSTPDFPGPFRVRKGGVAVERLGFVQKDDQSSAPDELDFCEVVDVRATEEEEVFGGHAAGDCEDK